MRLYNIFPRRHGDSNDWVLPHTPTGNLAVYWNGVRQAQVIQYTLRENVITLLNEEPSIPNNDTSADIVVCDYDI